MSESNEVIKSYKGFNKDMTCREFQYEEDEDYETDTADCCSSGFHACEMPLDTFKYYEPSKSVYHQVEQSGELSRDDDDTKVASTKIHIGARIGLCGLVKAQIEFVFDKIKKAKEKAETNGDVETSATSGNGSTSATSGDRSTSATSGDRSTSATSGDRSTSATSGDRSTSATSGDRSTSATSGYGSTSATSGDWSTSATSGDWSTSATSGYRSTSATSGNGSTSATSGEESTSATSNKNAIAVACGKNAMAKGVIGSYIVVTEWNDEQDMLLSAQMVRIDGDKYKEDTWYKMKDGEIVEVIQDEAN